MSYLYLTEKMKVFIDSFTEKDTPTYENVTESGLKAYDTISRDYAYRLGSRLMKLPKIQDAIAKKRLEQALAVDVDKPWVLAQLVDNVKKCKELRKFAEANRALEIIAKIKNFIVDRGLIGEDEDHPFKKLNQAEYTVWLQKELEGVNERKQIPDAIVTDNFGLINKTKEQNDVLSSERIMNYG